MADEQSEQPKAQEPSAPQQEWTRPDWFLRTLVNLTNAGDGNGDFGMTLLVGGFLVSGNVIGGARYFDLLSKDFTRGITDPGIAEAIRASLAECANIYRTKAAADSSQLPTYVHLMDVRCFNTAGSPIPTNGGILWRGRLSEVSGFMLGTVVRQ